MDENFAAAEIRALLAVARDERARKGFEPDSNDVHAEDSNESDDCGDDSASVPASSTRVSALDSFAAFVARLRDAGGFDSAEATLDAAATFSDASTSRE